MTSQADLFIWDLTIMNVKKLADSPDVGAADHRNPEYQTQFLSDCPRRDRDRKIVSE